MKSFQIVEKFWYYDWLRSTGQREENLNVNQILSVID